MSTAGWSAKWWADGGINNVESLAGRELGTPLSTLDLFGGSLVLLAGPEGEPWQTAARAMRATFGAPWGDTDATLQPIALVALTVKCRCTGQQAAFHAHTGWNNP